MVTMAWVDLLGVVDPVVLLTWNLNMMVSKMNLLFQGGHFQVQHGWFFRGVKFM